MLPSLQHLKTKATLPPIAYFSQVTYFPRPCLLPKRIITILHPCWPFMQPSLSNWSFFFFSSKTNLILPNMARQWVLAPPLLPVTSSFHHSWWLGLSWFPGSVLHRTTGWLYRDSLLGLYSECSPWASSGCFCLLSVYTYGNDSHCQVTPRLLQNGINRYPASCCSSDWTVWVPSTTSLKGVTTASQTSAARGLKSCSQELSSNCDFTHSRVLPWSTL